MSDFNTILKRMLDRVPDTFDKRVGSVIYDALAPIAAEQAQININKEIWKEQSYLLTSTNSNLDLRASDFGMSRQSATYAKRIGQFYDLSGVLVDVSLDSRYAAQSDTESITYVAIERISQGVFILASETAGSVGNVYYGDILPLQINNRLGRAAITGTQVPGEDTETDSAFLSRILLQLRQPAFGGNISDYLQKVNSIDGVGDTVVFPVWNGGNTILVSVVDSDFNPASSEFVIYLKDVIDPISQDPGIEGGMVSAILSIRAGSSTDNGVVGLGSLDTTIGGSGLGIAPIGHVVTVTTPTEFVVNISAAVTMSGGSITQIQDIAEQNIRDYLLTIRQSWASNVNTSIRNIIVSGATNGGFIDGITVDVLSLLVANAIYGAPHVTNVPEVYMNGESGDLRLSQTAILQQLPSLGVLNLYER